MKPAVRIVAMSDTHSFYHKIDFATIPPGDIFIHAGDFTQFSLKNQLQDFRNFLKMLPYKHKVVIAGNHDFALDQKSYEEALRKSKHGNSPILDPAEQIAKLKEVCTYLQHEMVEIMGLKIFGSPYQPEFFDWGFMYAAEKGEEIWSTIPKDIDVLITHGPPFGILDLTVRKEHVGCKGLLKFVQKLKPQVHIFGHIHQGYGKMVQNGVQYYNASNVNVFYRLVNPPLQIVIAPREHHE